MKLTNKIKVGTASVVLVSVLTGISALSGNALAQTGARETVYFTLPPSPEVLAAHLFGDEIKQPLTRSISFKKKNTSIEPANKSVTMPILFHFGKTTITHDSKPFLDNVGKMLVANATERRVLVVEGHTDSVGSYDYNQGLSERRASAVRDYLVTQFGISPARLIPVGRGESTLYNTANPKSGENRRVEFVPYTSS